MTTIGQLAFNKCSSLTKIKLSNKVTIIDYNTFGECSSLASVTFGENITKISESAFKNCKLLNNVVIPDSVKSIEGNSFSGCTSLTILELGSGVSLIGAHAFYGCSALAEVVIPANVSIIGEYAFTGCDSLKEVFIPKTVSSIGRNGFGDLRNTRIFVEYAQTEVPEGWHVGWYTNSIKVFYGITGVIVESNDAVYEINKESGSATFVTVCDSAATSATINSSISFENATYSVTEIGDRAFWNSAITTMVIPNSVSIIGHESFTMCKSLQSVNIPKSVVSIGESAFEICKSLERVDIPDSVKDIGNSAFVGCEKIEIHTTLTSKPVGWSNGMMEDMSKIIYNSAPLAVVNN